MSKMVDLISANKAYNFACMESKARLYASIENAAKCGDMFYDVVCGSLTDETFDELKNAGYEIIPHGDGEYIRRISWKHAGNASNQQVKE